MKSSKEFIERLQSDEEFAKEVSLAVKEKHEAGEDHKAIIGIAADRGYELTAEEVDEMYDNASELSEEELQKVAGGTSPGCIMLTIFLSEVSLAISVTIYETINY